VPLATGTLQLYLANKPEAGDVIPSTGGGFRRVRWGAPRRAQGRRGGLRVIYYLFLQDSLIWFVTLYGKDEAAALTASGEDEEGGGQAEPLPRAHGGCRRSRVTWLVRTTLTPPGLSIRTQMLVNAGAKVVYLCTPRAVRMLRILGPRARAA
jgi:hypothetical protein